MHRTTSSYAIVARAASRGERLMVVAIVCAATLLTGESEPRAQWVKDGVRVCASSGDEWYAYLTPDAEGGAIIAWEEVRSGVPYDFDLFVQRLDRDGNILWAESGVPICSLSGAQMDPLIVPDGHGGAIIAWRDQRSGSYDDIYAQRVASNGAIQWAENGVPVAIERYGQYICSVVPDGRDSFILLWRDDRSGVGQIYCQKLNGAGLPEWQPNGIAVCPTSYWQDRPRAVPDGTGGVVIVWEDERYSIINSYVYGQRIDSDGRRLWAEIGVPISLSSGTKWALVSISDGSGGAFVCWSSGDDRLQNVFAQRIDTAGVIWSGGDVAISTAPLSQDGPSMALDGTGGAIIAWHDFRDSCDDVYAQRLSGEGKTLWASNGIPICTNPPLGATPWTIPAVVSDGAGGAIIAWQWGWGTSSYYDIFAQRVDPNGALLWPDTGVVVCRAPHGQYYPQMISNGEGGTIIAWRDMRFDSVGAVYAMRVTANGETVATLLQSFTASARGSRIVLEWTLAEADPDVRFIVLRASGGGAFELLASADTERENLSFSFTDGTCRPAISYRYRVDIETGGERRVLFETKEISLPAPELSLAQNYPNPFNPATTIRFALPERGHVDLVVYDCSGMEVARLLDADREAGVHEVVWNGKSRAGGKAASGIYFYRLTAGKTTLTKKMVLLK
jgi:hypothetical protein